MVLVQSLSHVQPFATSWTAAQIPSSLSPGICSNSCTLSRWCPSKHLILCHPLLLLSSVFPSIGSFPVSWLFASGGQNIGASASASVLPMNIWGWFLLGLTCFICLPSKGLWGVFSSSTDRKHQFFDTQLSLWSNSQERITLWSSNSKSRYKRIKTRDSNRYSQRSFPKCGK